MMMEALFHYLACWQLSFLSIQKLVESCDSEISAVAALVARFKRLQRGHYWSTLDQIKLTNQAVRRSFCGELPCEYYQECSWLASCHPPNPHTWSLVCRCCFQFTIDSIFDALYSSEVGHYIYYSQRRASCEPYRELTQLNFQYFLVLEYLLPVFWSPFNALYYFTVVWYCARYLDASFSSGRCWQQILFCSIPC